MAIQTVNPSTGKPIKDYPEMSATDVDKIIENSHQAYLQWREFSFADRAKLMKKLADLMDKHIDEYATLMANEMGKPITAGQAEIQKCQWVCHYYADNAERFLSPKIIETELQKSYVTYKPIGIVFAIMPWNFPFWQVFRFAAPNIMAGNSAILSHAPISTGTGIAIEKLFEEAGFPKKLFSSVIVNNEVAKHIIQHPKVRGVTLTGSERAGQAVGAEAAGALKKVVLELGGSDPYVILEDADLELAADEIVTSRMNNTGQVCISAKRIIAVDEVHDELVKRVMQKLDRIKMGDPLDVNANFGPMARQDLRDEVHQQVQQSVKNGAELLIGGELPDKDGFYYPPTVLTNVKEGMPAMDEEIFGPVISFIKVKNEDEAITIANDTCYGLAGAVFTKDIKRGEAIAADKIHAGTVYVNGHVASDPRLPFGGIKNSGYGRELSSQGIHEFVNIKTVGIK